MTGSDTWTRLRDALERAWRWSRKSRAERRSVRARSRFWDELREGEREAESRTRR